MPSQPIGEQCLCQVFPESEFALGWARHEADGPGARQPRAGTVSQGGLQSQLPVGKHDLPNQAGIAGPPPVR